MLFKGKEKKTAKRQDKAILSARGREILDPKPLVLDGSKPPPPIEERIKSLIRNELSQKAQSMEKETFDEANDFEVEDNFERSDLSSAYTVLDEELPVPQGNFQPEPDAQPPKAEPATNKSKRSNDQNGSNDESGKEPSENNEDS